MRNRNNMKINYSGTNESDYESKETIPCYLIVSNNLIINEI